MDIQYVNIGNVVNDGTGDDLYTAFMKINQNLQQIDYTQAQNNTASNLGSVGLGVYKEKVGADLRFKKLVAGNGIAIVDEPNDLRISGTGAISTIVGNSGTYTTTSPLSSLNLVGGSGITVGIVGNTITINSQSTLFMDTSPRLGGNLNLNNYNIAGTGTVTATKFFGLLEGNVSGNLTGNVNGNVTGSVDGVNVGVLGANANNFDFGTIVPQNISPDISFLNWFKANLNIDLGSFTNPVTTFNLGTVVDGGTV